MRSRTVGWIGLAAAALGLAVLLVVGVSLRPTSPERERATDLGPHDDAGGTHMDHSLETSGSDAALRRARTPSEGATAPPPTPRPETPSVVPVDEGTAPSPALVRRAFESALADRFPDRSLSPEEIERASGSLVELREARVALRSLPPDAAHAEERRRLIERIGHASSRFHEVLGMDPAEFTARAEPGIGVDAHDPEEAVPEPEFLESRP